MWLEVSDLVLKITSLVVATTSVVLVYRQIVRNHEWNRRKATQDMLLATMNREEIRQLAAEFGVVVTSTSTPAYEALLGSMAPEKRHEFQYLVRTVLNHHEAIANGIKNDIYDEDLVYEYLGVFVSGFLKWASPCVVERRAFSPLLWIDQEYFAERWSARAKEDGAKGIARLRSAGKKPM